jgi:alpha-N-arabinofuranosidase
MHLSGGAAAAGMVLWIGAVVCGQPPVNLTVYTDQPTHSISPMMYGLFFEDINFGADGGLYEEKVKNRSFEFPDAMTGWTVLRRSGTEGDAVVICKQPYKESDARALRLTVKEPGNGFGVSNEGFRGIGLHQGREYYFTVFARVVEGGKMPLRIEAVSPSGTKVLEGTLEVKGADWTFYQTTLKANATEPKTKLNVLATAKGTVDLDMVSLFPVDTARQADRPIPGLRKDLVQMLADVRPAFLRFPGGCIVEGATLALRYQWKNTIGDLSDRKTLINRWNTEFRHRLTPDYYQSFGLGFFEYFLLCEQIGAEPVPILNCGMACQFNTGETCAVDKLGPYVQDALDLIEFANGPADSRWGRVRVQMGHPEPFGLKYLGIGNEQWGPQYIERYKVFEKALREKYPNIKLIAGCGSEPEIFPNGPAEIEYLWSQWRVLKPDIVDEHFYRRYPRFFDLLTHYDSYDRQGPKIFVGEYAAMSHGVASPENRNNLICALAEAAFLTGLERNGDVVTMTAYAPLSAHVDAWQWKPNLIWFDNLSCFGTPNYYVQKLFSHYKGMGYLKSEIKTQGGDPLYVSVTQDADGQVYIKAVNPSQKAIAAQIQLDGRKQFSPQGRVIVLRGRPEDENTMARPQQVVPQESQLNGVGSRFAYEFAPVSLTVLVLKP